MGIECEICNGQHLTKDHQKATGASESALIDLLACPFCGGKASADGSVKYYKGHEVWWEDGSRVLKAYFVNCLICGVSNKGMVGHQTRDKAIKKWNARA